MATYTIHVTRDDGLWSAVVNGLPQGMSAGYDFEHFADLREGVREALIDLIGHADFTLEWHFATERHDFTRVLGYALSQAEAVELARAHLDRARQSAITQMKHAGLSYRDIGDALEMSHQRVAQLMETYRKTSDVLPVVNPSWVVHALPAVKGWHLRIADPDGDEVGVTQSASMFGVEAMVRDYLLTAGRDPGGYVEIHTSEDEREESNA